MTFKEGYLKSVVFGALVLVFIMFSYPQTSLAVGVRPLVIDLQLRPGETQEFELVLNPGDSVETVDVSLYEPIQQISGGLTYEKPEFVGLSAVKWVMLDQNQVEVAPGSETRATGRVTVPFSAGGSYTVILMVEPRAPKVEQGITFQVRYAVKLNMRVEKPGLRPLAELVDFTVLPNEQGAPTIRTLVKNPSLWDFEVSGEAIIRDKNRRLINRIPLRTLASLSAGSVATRVYPGAEVEFTGEILKPLAPGEYVVQTFFRYGENGQILRNHTVVIKPGDYVFPGFEVSAFLAISPPSVKHQLRAGERKSQIFELENMEAQAFRIELALAEITSDYEHSLVDWIELRSQQEFLLQPGSKSRMAMTIAVPRDVPQGSYHAKVVFTAFPIDSNEPVIEHVIPLDVFVGTDLQPEIEIRSLTTGSMEDGGLYLSVDLFNNGNVAFLPRVTAMIAGGDGQLLEKRVLELPEELVHLLPKQSQQVGLVTSLTEPGDYKIAIEIETGGRVIVSETHEIQIPSE